jgi:hypothetical protein
MVCDFCIIPLNSLLLPPDLLARLLEHVARVHISSKYPTLIAAPRTIDLRVGPWVAYVVYNIKDDDDDNGVESPDTVERAESCKENTCDDVASNT